VWARVPQLAPQRISAPALDPEAQVLLEVGLVLELELSSVLLLGQHAGLLHWAEVVPRSRLCP